MTSPSSTVARREPGAADLPLSELEAEFAALWQARKSGARDLAALLHPRLDPTALPLIAELGSAGPSRPSDLVRRLLLDPSTVSRQISAAQKLGLVDRGPDPDDARALLVGLTPHAQAMFADYHAKVLARWHGTLEGWSRNEVETLTALLRRLREGS